MFRDEDYDNYFDEEDIEDNDEDQQRPLHNKQAFLHTLQ